MAAVESQRESGDQEEEERISYVEWMEYQRAKGRGQDTSIYVSDGAQAEIEEAATRINLLTGLDHSFRATQNNVIDILLKVAETAELNGDLDPTEKKLAAEIQESLRSEPNPFRQALSEWGVSHAKISRLMRNGYDSVEDIQDADPDELLTISHIGEGTVNTLKKRVPGFGESADEVDAAEEYIENAPDPAERLAEMAEEESSPEPNPSPDIEVEEPENPEEYGRECPYCPAVKVKPEIAPHIAEHDEFDGRVKGCPLCSRPVPEERFAVHVSRCES